MMHAICTAPTSRQKGLELTDEHRDMRYEMVTLGLLPVIIIFPSADDMTTNSKTTASLLPSVLFSLSLPPLFSPPCSLFSLRLDHQLSWDSQCLIPDVLDLDLCSTCHLVSLLVSLLFSPSVCLLLFSYPCERCASDFTNLRFLIFGYINTADLT